MLKGNELIGAFFIYRTEVRPFTEKQIELVQNFAAQAVIAIENARLLNELRQRTGDLSEALEQQTATSEVLKVISSSPGELKTVFQTLLENATRICEAAFGSMLQREGDVFRRVALHNAPAAFAEFHSRAPLVDPRKVSDLKRVVETKQVVHVADTAAEHPDAPIAKYAGGRTLLIVPMLKDEELIGIVGIYRQEVRPFSDKQIEIVKNFASQAVIAIENTRLLNELRQRTDDLSESLEQQTATSEVLKVISSSPNDLGPVFHSMLGNSVRICEAKFGQMFLCEGDNVRAVAHLDVPAALVEWDEQRGTFRPSAEGGLMRAMRTKNVIHIDDFMSEQPSNPVVKLGGARSYIAVPMLKENELVGVIVIYRQEVRPFTEKQIDLVRNFATQAVIAIENARLLNELRESLEQQTATSDVLKAISSSLDDLTLVFETIGQRAEKLCDAEISLISMVDGDLIRLESISGVTEKGVETVRQVYYPMRRSDETVAARAIRSGAICHVPDVLSDPLYPSKEAARVAGFRGCLAVPMVRDEQVIGAIFVARREAGLFTDAQVQLLKTFAAQAVIAIENVRLFNETKEALERQTATADVLKVISRSTFDLPTVLQTLVESAGRLCNADKALITREKNGAFYRTEAYGFSPEFMEYIKNVPIETHRGSAAGRALLEGCAVHIADVLADPEYTIFEARSLGDFRTVLAVPMIREGAAIGVLILTRSEVRPFTDKQIELVTTFADQAAIAIENVRLFENVEARTRELATSLVDLRTTQDRWCKHRNLPCLVSSLPASRTRSRTRSILSIIFRVSLPN